MALVAPTGASAGPVDDLLNNVNNTVNNTVNNLTGSGGGGSSPSAAPTPAPSPAAAPTPLAATTEPPIDGTEPHGQGTVLGADIELITPGEQDVTIGQTRGSQDANGDYHGRIVIVSALGLEIPATVETDEGETEDTPTQGLNDLLADICAGSGNNVCLSVLDYESTTTNKSSQNSFSAATANIGNGLITTGLLTSEGNISQGGGCQTANGGSSAANVGALGAINVAALQGTSESTACRNGSKSTDADSTVATLNGTGVLEVLGCDEDQVDDEFGIPLLVDGVCNGDDTDGSQTTAPYNVRKALGLEVLPLLETLGVANGLLGVDAGSAESHAVAPEDNGDNCPDPNNPDCPTDECPDPTEPGCPGGPDGPGKGGPHGPGNGPAGPSANGPGNGNLPFTGADVLALALIGGGVMGVGLALMALADRRRRSSHA